MTLYLRYTCIVVKSADLKCLSTCRKMEVLGSFLFNQRIHPYLDNFQKKNCVFDSCLLFSPFSNTPRCVFEILILNILIFLPQFLPLSFPKLHIKKLLPISHFVLLLFNSCTKVSFLNFSDYIFIFIWFFYRLLFFILFFFFHSFLTPRPIISCSGLGIYSFLSLNVLKVPQVI